MSQYKTTAQSSKTGAFLPDLSTARENPISILNMSVRTADQLLAGPLQSNTNVTNLGQGTADTISVSCAARASGLDVGLLRKWAAAGGYFFHLCWIFTRCPFLKILSRHLLVGTEDTAELTFNGGLGWAFAMLDREQALREATSSSFQRPHPSSFQPGPASQLKLPCRASDLGNPESSRHGALPAASAPNLLDPLHGSRPVASLSRSLDLGLEPYAETTETLPSYPRCEFGDEDNGQLDQIDSPGPLGNSSVATERSTPERELDTIDDEWTVELQLTIEILGRRRREAEDLFARNGDPSGLVSITKLASQFSGVWFPSGLPWF
ncbi:hypothetical protein B0H67DRAFT_338096 [Lasiosphaeris hirsuta]|uniref:Uncharacterized protein n=1 Tax=Lasiosphaeris hirsuta TaxID=260670 RepID=A0AA40A328_9PEZI|nr:hypothetical protein B0H67DRAFT_338096 [Lasiosphaeris hirsuta]